MSSSRSDGGRWALLAVTAAVLVAADQGTKHWALGALSDGSTIDVVWTLQFNLAFNTGMSFSLGSGMGPVIAPLALLVVVGLVWMARQITSTAGLIGVGVVIGGVLGNLVDRAFRAGDGEVDGFMSGAVVDFIDLQWWPIFNIADMCIVIGALLLIVATWREERAESVAAADAAVASDRDGAHDV